MNIFIKLPSEDGFDGSGIWSIVSTELSKKIGSDVTHFKLGEHETNVYLNLGKLVLQWKLSKRTENSSSLIITSYKIHKTSNENYQF